MITSSKQIQLPRFSISRNLLLAFINSLSGLLLAESDVVTDGSHQMGKSGLVLVCPFLL